MTENNKQYQIILLLPPSLNQDALSKIVQKTKKIITDQQGSFLKETEPIIQLKKLSYPIKKHNEAFYLTFNNVSLPTETVGPVTEQMNLDNELLRHLITVQPKNKETKEPAIDYGKMIERVEPMSQIKKSPISIESFPSKRSGQEKEIKGEKSPLAKMPKTQIEDLDKKLEEILDQ